MSLIVCTTITNAKDYAPERSTNGDSDTVTQCLKPTKPAAASSLTKKSITQVSRANPYSNRKHDGVEFTNHHQKLWIKEVKYMKGSAKWSQGKEKLMTRTPG